MYNGLANSCPSGMAEDCLLVRDVIDFGDGTGALVRLQAMTGYGDLYWGIVCAGRVILVVFLPEGQLKEFTLYYDQGFSEQAVSIVPNGGWPDDSGIDLTVQQQFYILDKANVVEVDFDCVIEVLSAFGDAAQFSGWSLSGLRRNYNSRATDKTTQFQIDIVLTNVAGTYTVSLQLGSLVIASGTIVGNGVVTLTAQNGSGLSGTVTLTFSGVLSLGAAYVQARWAAQYEVHCAPTLTFPRSPEAVVTDPGLANRLMGRVTAAPGNNSFLVRAITDTQVTGTNTAAAGTIATPGRPAPPTALALQSSPGNWTNTAIQFAASPTAGATYRIYDSLLDNPTDFNAAPGTHIADAGTITYTLPSLGSAGTGKRRISVVAVSGGIEDGYRRTLTIEYAAGVIILPRPNVPKFSLASKNGRAVVVNFSYDTTEQAGVGATVQLFLFRKGAAVSFVTPANTMALPTTKGAIKSGTISATAAADDWHQFAVLVTTAAGVQSLNTALSKPEWLSTAAPGVPGNVTATLVG